MLNKKIVYYIGIFFVAINLIIVLPYFGQPYGFITSKHTSLSELGWVLVAIYIALNAQQNSIKIFVYVTLIFIILYLPFGARMQPSFAILALLMYYSKYLSKTSILVIFVFLTTASLIIGVLRELALVNGGIEGVLTGFNQGAILRTSSVILQNSKTQTLSEKVINTMSTFLLYPLSGTMLTGPEIYLNYELDKFKSIQGNGGNFGTLLFFYFGYIFPVVIFSTTALLVKIKFLRILLIMAIVTSFRWQQYNFVPLLKIFPLVIFLGIILQFLTKKRKVECNNVLF